MTELPLLNGSTSILDLLIWLSGLLAVCGLAVVMAGAVAVQRFAALAPCATQRRPAVTVLKPLCGEEPLLDRGYA